MSAVENAEGSLAEFPEINQEHLELLGLRLAERIGTAVETKPRRRRPTVRFSLGLRKRQLGTMAGFKIFLVNGEHVRNNLETDFTMASHGHVSGFIRKDEIWMDDRLSVNDLVAVMHHEVFEVKLMEEGMPYEEAHALATESERDFRKLL